MRVVTKGPIRSSGDAKEHHCQLCISCLLGNSGRSAACSLFLADQRRRSTTGGGGYLIWRRIHSPPNFPAIRYICWTRTDAVRKETVYYTHKPRFTAAGSKPHSNFTMTPQSCFASPCGDYDQIIVARILTTRSTYVM